MLPFTEMVLYSGLSTGPTTQHIKCVLLIAGRRVNIPA